MYGEGKYSVCCPRSSSGATHADVFDRQLAASPSSHIPNVADRNVVDGSQGHDRSLGKQAL